VVILVRHRRAAGRGDRVRRRRHRQRRARRLIVIDTSTSEPATTTQGRAKRWRRRGSVRRAPLSRTPVEAEQGRLNTMVGGRRRDVREARAVFAAYCENVVHAGPPATAWC